MPYVNLEEMRGPPKGTIPVTEIPRKVKSIQFDTFTADDIRRLSHVNVNNAMLHESGKPNPFSLLDSRLGVCDKKGICGTCGLKLEACTGHFGHIDLPVPLFHIGFFKTVVQILRCVCKGCCKVLLPPGDERKKLLSRMRNKNVSSSRRQKIQQDLAAELSKVVECPHCGYINGRVRIAKAFTCPRVLHERYGEVNTKKAKPAHLAERDMLETTMKAAIEVKEQLKQCIPKMTDTLSPMVVKAMLEKIPPEDRELLDLDPNKTAASLLTNTVIVPPTCIRPYIDASATGGSVGEFKDDNLTMYLLSALRGVREVQDTIREGEQSVRMYNKWDALQKDYARLIDSSLPGYPARENDRPPPGLVQRLKGKEGRFRKHLSGKRVDFSGRTVISPDPNLKITEVAIPILVAKVLTYPERVYEFNRPRLCQAIINGAHTYPGAVYLKKKKGYKRGLAVLAERDRRRLAEELEIGDIVDRHMINGDCVIFNRQPSLHRISMMCHRARVLPYRTYRFNECCCAPYNADFDGDEMNIHLPQTEEARAECAILMSTARNMISARHGEPMIAATQDFLTGGYFLTAKNRFFDRGQASQVLAYMNEPGVVFELPPPCILKPRELWSGKQLFSLLVRPNKRIPVSLNFETKTKFYTKDLHMCERDGWVCFVDSELLTGTLDKKIMGGGGKDGLFYQLFLSSGHAYAARCMWRLSRFTCMWLMNYGFSIGINDVTPSVELIRRRDAIMQKGLDVSAALIKQFNEGTLVADPGCTTEITLEAKLNGYLSGVRSDCGSMCMKVLHWHNAPFIMATCGSKGSPLNIGQMAAVLGQQTVSGKRIGNGFIHRSLPHFERFSRKPEHRGFVANSFYSGLQPHEFWFHTMGGREGLVDTAVKTAETGYMQRRLVKAMEDLCVQYDYTVSDSQGIVIQRVFGDDGIDPLYTETTDFRPVNFDILWTNMSINRRRVSLKEKPLLPHEVMPAYDSMIEIGDQKNMFQMFSGKFREELRMFWEKKAKQLKTIWDSLEAAAAAGARATNPGSGSSALARMKQRAAKVKTDLIGRGRLQKLANDMLLVTEGLMETIILECIKKYEKYRCEPGTACGAIGAQSIGEPGTQMTLKTFHFAGVAAMSITQGVPRIAEIINAAKTIKTPLITGYLVNETCKRSAEVVRARVQQTKLIQIVHGFEEVYTPLECYILVRLNMDAIFNMQLDVDVWGVRQKILDYAQSTTRKRLNQLPLKEQHIPITSCTSDTIRICPYNTSRDKLNHCMSNILCHLPDIVVAGLSSVKRAILSQYDKEKRVVKQHLPSGEVVDVVEEIPKYNLLIEGCDLLQVSSVPGMDPKRTVSNHIWTIEHVLGIEAARSKIISEILNVMNNYGLAIDIRHMMQLADVMTFRGEVLGITRFGMSKMRDSVMMLASFEKTTDILFDAASHHRKDDKLGVSEQIIMGAPIKIGTGLFKLLQRVDKVDAKKKCQPIFTPPSFSTGVR